MSIAGTIVIGFAAIGAMSLGALLGLLLIAIKDLMDDISRTRGGHVSVRAPAIHGPDVRPPAP
jgi:hypothetical protein